MARIIVDALMKCLRRETAEQNRSAATEADESTNAAPHRGWPPSEPRRCTGCVETELILILARLVVGESPPTRTLLFGKLRIGRRPPRLGRNEGLTLSKLASTGTNLDSWLRTKAEGARPRLTPRLPPLDSSLLQTRAALVQWRHHQETVRIGETPYASLYSAAPATVPTTISTMPPRVVYSAKCFEKRPPKTMKLRFGTSAPKTHTASPA